MEKSQYYTQWQIMKDSSRSLNLDFGITSHRLQCNVTLFDLKHKAKLQASYGRQMPALNS